MQVAPTKEQTPAAPLVSAKIVAEQLGCTDRYVNMLAAAGAIPCYRINRLIRYNLPEVLTLLRCDNHQAAPRN